MIELILMILAEFGLLREDFKHRKKIAKKEKADGKKRPFQKYFLQPSFVIIISVSMITLISVFLFLNYQQTSIFPQKTEKEIAEMTDRMEQWKVKYGKYPANLNELIGNNPMQQEWKTDSWDRAYQYAVSENGIDFLITSAGVDGKFETEDDIKSK